MASSQVAIVAIMMIMVATGVIAVSILVITDGYGDCGYCDDPFGYLVEYSDQRSYLDRWVGMIFVLVIVITAVSSDCAW